MSRKTWIALVVVASLAPGYLMGQYAHRSYRSRETAVAQVSSARSVKSARAGKRNTTKQDSKLVVGVDAFIQRSLEGAKNNSKEPDAGDVVLIDSLIPKSSNWDELPPHVQELVQENKENWYFRSEKDRQKKSGYYVLYGKYRNIQYYDGRFTLNHHRLTPEAFMGVYNPQIPGKLLFVIPAAKLAAMDADDQAYADKLATVINDNINFIYRAPLFVPDMAAFKANIYGGTFIPEKYVLQGNAVTKVPKGVIEAELVDLYTTIGYPVWEPWRIDTGRITSSDCQWYSQYEYLKVLPKLILINYDGIQHEKEALALIRRVQYESAMVASTTFVAGLEAELAAQRGHKNREMILGVALKNIRKMDMKLQGVLKNALASGTFVYRIEKPSAKPPKRPFNLVGPNYTDGYRPQNQK